MLTIVGSEDLVFDSRDPEAAKLAEQIHRNRDIGMASIGKRNMASDAYFKEKLEERNSEFEKIKQEEEYELYLSLKAKFEK